MFGMELWKDNVENIIFKQKIYLSWKIKDNKLLYIPWPMPSSGGNCCWYLCFSHTFYKRTHRMTRLFKNAYIQTPTNLRLKQAHTHTFLYFKTCRAKVCCAIIIIEWTYKIKFIVCMSVDDDGDHSSKKYFFCF